MPIAAQIGQTGSSPLTRGKRSRRNQELCQSRLIPAHAGKTRRRFVRSTSRRDHPRSRGENSYAATIVACFAGSSPLTRGKRCPSPAIRRHRRLIPAHAGKTSTIRMVGPSGWAHPRSRGENRWARSRTCSAAGSSPLTRGKLMPSLIPLMSNRLIPAHAGKT